PQLPQVGDRDADHGERGGACLSDAERRRQDGIGAAGDLDRPSALRGPPGNRQEPAQRVVDHGVCLDRNCLIPVFAAGTSAPVFHSTMNSAFGMSFATSSEIANGCASSLPASTRHGVRQLDTNARSTLYTKPGSYRFW